MINGIIIINHKVWKYYEIKYEIDWYVAVENSFGYHLLFLKILNKKRYAQNNHTPIFYYLLCIWIKFDVLGMVDPQTKLGGGPVTKLMW